MSDHVHQPQAGSMTDNDVAAMTLDAYRMSCRPSDVSPQMASEQPGKSVEVKRTLQGLLDAGVEPRRLIHVCVHGWRVGNLGLLLDAVK